MKSVLPWCLVVLLSSTLMPGATPPANGNAPVVGVLQGAASFAVGPPSPATSSLTAPVVGTVADGQNLALLRLVVRDGGGYPVSGTPVTFLPPTDGTLQAVAAGGGNLTGSDGSLSFGARASSTGQLTLQASCRPR